MGALEFTLAMRSEQFMLLGSEMPVTVQVPLVTVVIALTRSLVATAAMVLTLETSLVE